MKGSSRANWNVVAPAKADSAGAAGADAAAIREALHLFCHDFRVPLTSVSAYAELLRSADLSPDQRAQFVSSIEHQAQRLARMVDDLESLAQEHPKKLSSKAMDLELVLRSAAANADPSACARGVAVEVEMEGGPVHARGDADQLERALTWILEAALRRTPQGGELLLTGSLLGEEACAWVTMNVGRPEPEEIAALTALSPGGRIPDLVRGVAGPLWVSLANLAASGVRSEILAREGGLIWSFFLPLA